MRKLMPVNILCVGMIFCDTYIHGVDAKFMDLPADTYVKASDVRHFLGGDAQNMAVNLQRMGHKPLLIGCVGNDGSGHWILSQLKSLGMDVSHVKQSNDMGTATVYFVVDDGGIIHGMSYAGANRLLTAEDVPDDAICSNQHLHIGSLGPLVALSGRPAGALLQRAKAQGLSTSMDISLPYGSWEDIEYALHHCDYFLPNIEEIELLLGTRDLDEIHQRFRPYGLKALIVKMGENGIFVTDFESSFTLPSLYRGDVVDVLGAGDAFCTGFISALLNGTGLRDSAIYASGCSALCLGTLGASNWAVDMNEIAAYVESLGYCFDM